MKKILFFVSFAIVAAVFVQPRTTLAAGCQINAVLLPDPSGSTNYRYSSDIQSNISTVATTMDGTRINDQDFVLDYSSNGSCTGGVLDVYQDNAVNGDGPNLIGTVATHSDPNQNGNLYDPNGYDGGPGFGPTTSRLIMNSHGGQYVYFEETWAPGKGYEWIGSIYLTQHGTLPPTNYYPSSGGVYGDPGPVALVQAMALPSSNISITNSCDAGGTWTLSPTGQTGTASSDINVSPDPKSGTTYTVSFTPPDGYLGTVDPASQTLYGQDQATFTASCSKTKYRCPDGSQVDDPSECSCLPPTSQTQTLDCSTAHGSGYTGSITQQRTTSAYPSCAWSDWVTTSDTCVPAACTPPLTETQTLSCGAGYTGEIDQEQTKSAATDNPACTFPGTWTTTSNTCVPIPTSTINVSSNLAAIWSIVDNLGNTVGSTNGPETSDSYTVNPQPGGTAYTISPGSLSGHTLDTSNTVTGSGSTFTLFGDNDSGTFNLLYTAVPPPFTYSLSNSGDASVMQGNPVQEVITKTLTGGSAQAVGLSLPSLPSGVTVSGISSQGCTLTCNSTISLNVAASVSPGTYPIEVDGTPNNQTTDFNLVVAPTPNINVTCTASPAVAKVGQSVSWTASATGGSGSYVSYSWSGTDIPTAPNVPTSNPYAITYSTVGSKSAAATVTDSNGKTGTCTAGTAVVSVNPTFQEF